MKMKMNQEPLISVIITPGSDENTLYRCLNSIKQQEYENYEIILADQIENTNLTIENIKCLWWKSVLKAIENVNGEYILFCSQTSILSSNVLAEMLNKVNDKGYWVTNYIGLDGSEAQKEKIALSIYGHLFKKVDMMKYLEDFKGVYPYLDYSFMAQNINESKLIQNIETAYIYDSKIQEIFYDNFVKDDIEKLNTMVFILSEIYSKRELEKIYDDLIDRIDIEKKKMQFIVTLAKNYMDEYEWNYKITEKYVVPIFVSCKETYNNDIFMQIKEYLNNWSAHNEFQNLLMTKLKINEKEIFFEYPVEKYVFFENNRMDNNTKEKTNERLPGNIMEEFLNIAEEIKDQISDHIREVRIKTDNVLNNSNNIANSLELNGPDLANFVIEKYRFGKLGFRTILHCISAWIKYKMGGIN